MSETLKPDGEAGRWRLLVPAWETTPATPIVLLILAPILFSQTFGKLQEVVLLGFTFQKALVPVALFCIVLFAPDKFRIQPYTLWILAFVVLSSTSFMLGHEMDYLMIFVSLLGYFLLANIVCYSVRSFRDVEVLLYVYLWGHAVVAVLCLAATSGIVDVGKAFGHPLASEAWFGLRLFLGTENNPNGSAAHYVVGLPICLYAFMTTRGTKKWLLLVLLVAMTLELVMTLGRSALIGAAIGCVIVLYFIAPARGKKLAIYVVPAVALAGMIFLPIMIHTYANLFGSGSAMQGAAVLIASKNESNEVHGNVLQGAVLLAATAPPWGIGFGNTSAAMQTLTGYYLNTHNFFLGVAVSYGIPALIVFVIALFVAIREVWSATLLEPDRKRRGAYAAILGAIVGYLVSAMVHEDYVNSLFWTMISLALACGTVAGKARAPLIVCSENLGTGEEFYVGRD